MRGARRPDLPLDADSTAALLGAVPRETLARLELYLERLRRWQSAINLVGPATLVDPWRRHILDCAQLWRDWPSSATCLADLGSGAGLPGLILAILGVPETHLVESDRRKASFLRETARDLGVSVTVHVARAEALPPLAADVVTARALAPLPELLPLAHRHLAPAGTLLLLKGRTVEAELALAHDGWTMHAVCKPSLSDPAGTVLIINRLTPKKSSHV